MDSVGSGLAHFCERTEKRGFLCLEKTYRDSGSCVYSTSTAVPGADTEDLYV
jgi:hypothetical protein